MFRFHRTAAAQRARATAAFRGAAAAAVTAVALAGCASETGARDGGVAPSLSPPVRPSPLWPQYQPPRPPGTGQPGPAFKQYPAVPIELPGSGLAGVSVRKLLERDPNVPQLVRAALADCPGARCGLRAPVHRDLTGDGDDELVVAFDEPSASLTLVQVYRASGRTVRPVLITWGQLGLTGETFGRDLVITSTGHDGSFTTRYRWNGTVMAPGASQNEPRSPAAPTGATAGQSGTATAPQTRTPR
ncbi:hypothetical protein [Streptomyces sp. NPDC002889]|uniref:hypothetical protein n=1 Tax=Streptomyces sp. NPDC002889 TaxID=3364669 RepID=UPI0036CB832A